MVIIDYKPEHFDEVVDMYYQLVHEVYPHRTFLNRDKFEDSVNRWIELNYDIMLTEFDGKITGFILCYVDNMGGICDYFYQIECVYVKSEYRKSSALHLMVGYALNYANIKDYILSGNASEITESSKISAKYGIKVLTKYERIPNGT